MEALYILVLLLPLPVLLNRWRGTGDIVTLGKIRITGVMIYALYLALVVGCLSTWYYGILTAILFIAGESFAWGKWIGYLVSENGEKEYWNDNGKNFPFIHQTANFFVKEKVNYKLYCQIALTIRGIYWFLPMLVLFGFAGLMSWSIVAISTLVLGIGFPIACELAKYWKFRYVSKWLVVESKWEKQEVIYGLFHWAAICLPLVISYVG